MLGYNERFDTSFTIFIGDHAEGESKTIGSSLRLAAAASPNARGATGSIGVSQKWLGGLGCIFFGVLSLGY